jgi:SAM-dependent methyltransferase
VTTPGPARAFDARADVYELLIDWPRRLASEEPFYRGLFAELGARRVLDAACGNGHHAAMFHGWGLQVEGADIGPGMIAGCRRRFGEPAGLQWRVRSFEEPPAGAGFDAVICVGNSLALASDLRRVEAAILSLVSGVRPGGACVVQVLNAWSLPETRTVWQKCRRVRMDDRDHLLLKCVRRVGDRGHIDFADIDLTGAGAAPQYDAAEFLALEADHLAVCARAAGCRDLRFYGSFQAAAYERGRSTDLILVARRQPGIHEQTRP